MIAAIASCFVAATAVALPGPPSYNPVLKIIQGNQPLVAAPTVDLTNPSNPYILTITAPTQLANGATFPITIQLGKELVTKADGSLAKPASVTVSDALSFLTLSPAALTFTAPGQQLTTIVAVNVPAGTFAGDYAWTIKGLNWPGITDLGAQVNATVLPPLDTTTIKPVVSISNPHHGDIFTYLPGGPAVQFNIDYSATVAEGGQTLNSLIAYFDGVPLSGTIISGGLNTRAASATAPSPALTDGGLHTIQVRAQNNTGEDTKTIEINVHTPAKIVENPESLTRYVGDGASFVVAATGAPAPWYQWYKDGNIIPGATSAQLTFSSASVADAGSYRVVVANGVGSPVTSAAATFTVLKRDQQITFNALSSRTYGDPAFTLTATASSSLPVAFASSDPSIAEITGTTITIRGVGVVVITASQSGSDAYNPAPNVARELVITKAVPRITWPNPDAITYPTTLSGAQLNAVANVAGTFVYSVASGARLDAGSYTLNTTFTPDDLLHYTTAGASVPLIVNKANQTIDFPAIAAKYVDDSPFTLVASATASPVTFTTNTPTIVNLQGSTVSLLGVAGTARVTASAAATINYNAASPVTREFEVRAHSVKISGVAYLDTNGSRQYDAGDGLLSGLTVLLRDGTTTLQTTTTVNGSYLFADVQPGRTYSIAITPVPTGLAPISPVEFNVAVASTDMASLATGFELDFDALRGVKANGFTIGYWKNNLSKAIAGKPTGTQQTFEALWVDTDEIRQGPRLAPLDPFGDFVTRNALGAPVTDGMKSAVAIMSSTSSDPATLLKKQLLASEYNFANNAWLGGNETVTAAFIYWGEYVAANVARFSPAYVLWAKDWFDAYNNSHGGLVAGPAPLGSTSIATSFNNTSVPAGDTIWFNAVVNVGGRGGRAATVDFTRTTVQFSVMGYAVTLDVPDGQIIFDPNATIATTEYDDANDVWRSRVPASFTGDVFLTAVALKVPAGVTLPGGINPVTWNGRFTSATTGLSAKWSWAASVYTQFNDDYDLLGVKPIDGDKLNAYKNGDNGGTPELYKQYVTAGARGGGGSNYTGSYSGAATVNVAQ